jgi:hypothetical protein
LELCQLAIDNLNNRAFGDMILAAKIKELSTSDCYLKVNYLSYYGVTVYTITYSVQGTHIRYEFNTHEKTGDFSYELAPNLYQTSVGDE